MRGKLILLLLRFFSWMPLRLSHGIGTVIGLCLNVIPNSLRHITLTNLKLCFPEWSYQQQKTITQKSLIETGKSATEVGALWHWKPSRIEKLVKRVSGEEIVQAAHKKGKGIIFLTPHLGAWEIISLHLTFAYPNHKLTILYRPQPYEPLDNFILQSRERTGARLVPTSARGVKALYQALADKQNIGILPDQDPGNNGGIFVPFFGITANTMALVSRLAQKSGAPVVYIYAERLPKSRGYHIHFHDASDTANDTDTVQSTIAINQGIEHCVREHPEQYQWSYRRFKTRPEDKPGFY